MYIKATEKVRATNPKNIVLDSMEFNPKKGYRHVTQTENPKTGKLSNPKKGKYFAFLVRSVNDKGSINLLQIQLNGNKEINNTCKFISENFNLFSPEEVEYLYNTVYARAFISLENLIIFGGSDRKSLSPLYEPLFEACKKGIKTKENTFGSMSLDVEAIEATKPKDFNPFAVVRNITI